MKTRIFSVIFLFFLTVSIGLGADDDPPYVYLLKERKVTVEKDGEMKTRIHNRIRIDKEAAIEVIGEVAIPFNSYREKAIFVEAHTTTPGGTTIKVKKKAVRNLPISQVRDFNIYSDAKELSFSMPALEKGAIIDYVVELKYFRPVINGEAWDQFHLYEHVPVKKAVYTLETPKAMALTFDSKGIEVKPTVDTGWFSTTRTWTFAELKKLEWEPEMPPRAEVGKAIRWTSIKSWKTVDAWYQTLLKDKMTLTNDIKAAVKKATATCKTEREKIRAVYLLTQDKFRYVGIELGRSAYEPHTVADCFVNKYGDCKDKAVLIVALMRHVGVNAHVALARIGNNGLASDKLPSPGEFNHAIARVLCGKKTLWLDGTVKYFDEGSHPDQLDNTNVFVIGDDVHKLETIPAPDPKQSVNRTIYEIALNHNGTSRVKHIQEYVGRQGAWQRQRYRNKTEKERKEEIDEVMKNSWPNAHLVNHGHSDPLDLATPFRTWIEFEGQIFFSETETGLTAHISAYTGTVTLPRDFEEDETKKKPRRFPVVRRSTSGSETICRVTLPPGMSLAKPAPAFHKDLPEGTVTVSVTGEGNQVTAMASAYRKACTVAAKDFKQRAKDLNDLLKDAGRNVILINDAKKELADKNPIKAREIVATLIADHPKSAPIRHVAATVYSACGRVHRARQELRKAIELDPGKVEYYVELALSHAGSAGFFAKGHEPKKTREIMRLAVEKCRNKTAARKFLALCLEFDAEGNQRKDPKGMADAIKVYEAILKDKPKDVNSMNNIAECYFAMKDYDKAKTWFEKTAEEQYGPASGAWICLAFKGDTAAALKMINNAGMNQKQLTNELGRTAGILMEHRRYTESVAMFDALLAQMVEKDPTLLRLRDGLAKVAKANAIDYTSYNESDTPEHLMDSTLAALFVKDHKRIRALTEKTLAFSPAEALQMTEIVHTILRFQASRVDLELDLNKALRKVEIEPMSKDLVEIKVSFDETSATLLGEQGQGFNVIAERIDGRWYMASIGRKDPTLTFLAKAAYQALARGDKERAMLYVDKIRALVGRNRGLQEDLRVTAQMCTVRFPSDDCKLNAFIGAFLGGNQTHQGLRILKEALTLMPDNAVIKRAVAEKAIQAGRLSEGCRAYEEILKGDPDNKMVLYNYVRQLSKVGEHEKALAAKETLAKLIPSSRVIPQVEVELLKAAGKFQDALKVLKDHLFLYRDKGWSEHVFLQGRMGNRDAIKKLAKDAPRVGDGVSPQSHLILSLSLNIAGDDEGALAEMEKCLLVDPMNVSGRMRLASMLADSGELDDARAVFDGLMREDHRMEMANLGRLALVLGNYDEATRLMHDAIETDTGTELCYNVLFTGISELMAGRKEKAIELFKRGIELQSQGDWPRPHLRFLSGDLSLEELKKIAGESSTEDMRRHRLCELLFYAGALKVADNKLAEAKTLFKESAGLEYRLAWEHRMSKVALDRLSKGLK